MPSEQEKITRRKFAGQIGAAALGAIAAELGCGKSPTLQSPDSQPPNILLINSDDLGMGDLGCYGSEIPTPNIDDLAKQGMLFTDFYVSSPVCTPSRFSQLTGLVPQRSIHGLTSPLLPAEEKDLHRGIEPGETTIAKVLQQAEYSTALIGKWHLGHGDKRFMPNAHGFDYFYGFTPGCIDFFTHKYRGESCFYRNTEMIQDNGYVTDLFTDEAIKFLEQNTERPFYLNLAYNAPHYGKADAPGKASNVLQAPEELIARFNGPDRDRNVYSAMVVSMDDGVGRVMEALDRLGLADNTLVIFTSDNGADPGYGGNNGGFRGQKWDLWEGGIRIPCVMRFPGVIRPGTRTSQPCSHLDFFETFSTLAGLEGTKIETDGLDITPVLKNTSGEGSERTLFWASGPMAAARRGHWKYVRVDEDNSGDGQKQPDSRDLLFNLAEDPFESCDLSQSAPDLVVDLKRHLEDWEADINTLSDVGA